MAEEDLPAFREHLEGCAAAQEGCTCELTLVARDGRRIPVQLQSLSVRARDGSIFFRTALTDLAQRREMERSLRESREFLQTVIDTIPDAVIVVGRDYRPVLANRAAREMAGGEDPVKHPTWFRFLHQQAVPWGDEGAAGAFQQALETKAPVTVLQEHAGDNGARKVYEVTAAPVHSSSGDVVQVIEMSARRFPVAGAEEQLQEMNGTLERRVAERTAVARRRAVQLRALSASWPRPSSGNGGASPSSSAAMSRKCWSPPSARWTNSTRARRERSAAVLAEVDQLLARPLAESRELALELSPPVLYDDGLAAALRWVAGYMKRKHGLAVEVETKPGAEPADEGTRVFLFEAVRELLLNVIRYARTDRAWVSAAATDDGRLRLEIRDQGKGFDPAALEGREEIEDRFGLFAIRERLEMLGGRFQIESHPERGTRVVLVCPLGQPPRERRAPGSAVVPAGAGFVRRTRVIVADDHPTLRRGLADVLSEQPGIEIVGEAADGEHAVEVALETRPDVVLMDVMMPRLSGVEATRRILAELPETRVIGLSGYEEEEVEAAMHAAGAAAYLPKASPVETLLEAINPVAVH